MKYIEFWVFFKMAYKARTEHSNNKSKISLGIFVCVCLGIFVCVQWLGINVSVDVTLEKE